MIYLKNKKDIESIKKACAIWKKTCEVLKQFTHAGITTEELDLLAYKTISENNAICSFHLYSGFSGHICISVNDELIHGIPNKRVLKDGDMVTFDIGVTIEDHVCDSAVTVIIGNNAEASKMSDVTYKCLMESIKEIKPNAYTGDIGYKIESIAKENGYEVIKDFTGHGCGNHVHEDPMIPCYGKKNKGTRLVENMVLCIEPMLMTGTDQYFIDKNDWTVISKNRKLTCHWEHMVLVTKDGYEILTI